MMRSIDRVRGLVQGKPVDHLPVQPLVMMFAAKHAGFRYIDYTKDGRIMTEFPAELRECENRPCNPKVV